MQYPSVKLVVLKYCKPAHAGIYFVSSLYDGVDIGGSPFKLTIDPGPTHANGCSASGPGITGGYTGMETLFVIQVNPKFTCFTGTKVQILTPTRLQQYIY